MLEAGSSVMHVHVISRKEVLAKIFPSAFHNSSVPVEAT
jgi:hypothetical protein